MMKFIKKHWPKILAISILEICYYLFLKNKNDFYWLWNNSNLSKLFNYQGERFYDAVRQNISIWSIISLYLLVFALIPLLVIYFWNKISRLVNWFSKSKLRKS
ncbi:MAG: hypothetical protein AM1032_000363 [Mycoplasmataceae bacterium]|nr:MAG: hypothetical protein AM1032_000363 [Mycoplasmataceae bacterium]